MHRRVYWLLPDLASARATTDDLLRAGVEARRMHFTAHADCDLSDLPAANLLQTSDVLRSAEAGLVVGAAAGGVAGLFLASLFPGAGGQPEWSLVPALVLGGALFDAWTASMIGMSAPNRSLAPFAADLAQGWILLMLDVPARRAGEIQARLRELHPEARMEGEFLPAP